VDFDPSNHFLLGQQRRLIIRVVDFDPSNHFLLGQQRRLIIRVVDFDSSSHFFWASSAILLFELWISVPQIGPFRPAALLYYSNNEF
jgi:hypothetical protein